MVDGSLQFDTKIDSKGFDSGTQSISKSLGNFKSALGKIGTAIAAAFSVKVLVDFVKKAVETASDLQEVQNVVDTVFGDMRYKMEQFADASIEQFGISKLAAKQTGSTFMAMAVGMDVAKDTASDMAVALTGLSADMASFYNVEQDIASTALKSVFTGETETLKQFGIVMTEANLQAFALSQGITKDISAMSQAEKVQLRYSYVMQQTALAQGDFAKTSDGWANQVRILSEKWKEFSGTLGNVLMQVALPVIKTLNNALSALISYANSAADALANLFGWELGKSTGALADETAIAAENYEDMADSAKAAKKANEKSMASFDELNVLADQSQKNAGTLSSTGMSTSSSVAANRTEAEKTETIGLISKLQEYLKPLQEINLENLDEPFKRLQKAVKPITKSLFSGLEWAYFNLFVPLSTFTIEEVVPRFIDTLSTALEFLGSILNEYGENYEQFYNEFLKPLADFTAPKILNFIDKFNKKFELLVDRIKKSEVFDDLRSIFQKVYPVLVQILKPLMSISMWFADFFLSDAFVELEAYFRNLEDAIGLVAAVLNWDFSDAWEHFKDLIFDNKIERCTDKLNLMKDKFDELKIAVGEFVSDWKEKIEEAFDAWAEDITAWWDEDVSPWFTAEKWNELLQNVIDAFAVMWNSVYDFFSVSVPTWWDENIAPWFTKEKWTELLQGVKEAFKSVFYGVAYALIVPFNFMIDMINKIIDGVNQLHFDIPRIAGITDGFTLGFHFEPISHIPVPALATGAVIPPNQKFLAMLGDQTNGRNLEAPESLIRQIVREETANNPIEMVVSGNLSSLIRLLNIEFKREQRRESAFHETRRD